MKSAIQSILFVAAAIVSTVAASASTSYAQAPLAGHLSFAGEGVHAHLYWEQGPIADGESVLRVEFKSAANHAPTAIASTLKVVPTMPMGSETMGAPPVTIQKVVDANGAELPGVYRVSGIYLMMAGDWNVAFTLVHGDQSSESQVWKINVPESGTSSPMPMPMPMSN